MNFFQTMFVVTRMTRKNLLLSGEQVPELIGAPKDWINGKPVKMADLKGKVIVAFYWTFQ